MDTNTRENSIKVLKKLRDVYQSQLDASVIVEIEEVLVALENGCETSEAKGLMESGVRVLALMAEILRLVTNVADLMSD